MKIFYCLISALAISAVIFSAADAKAPAEEAKSNAQDARSSTGSVSGAELANVLVALNMQDRSRRPTTRPSTQRPGQYRPGVPRPRPVRPHRPYRPYRPHRPVIIPVPIDPYYRGRYNSRGQCRSWSRSCDRGYNYACRRYANRCLRSSYSSNSCRRSFEDCEDGIVSACRSYRRRCLD